MTPSHFTLNNKIILVTGAAGHLGSAITQRLYEAGATVIMNGRDKDKLEALATSIEVNSERLLPLDFDISDSDTRQGALNLIDRKYGRLDGLVNNAFTAMAGSVDEATAQDFQDCFNVNVSATFALCQESFALLQAQASPKSMSAIVNIASMYGMVSPDPSIYGDSGMNNPPFYGASKAALIQLTKYFAGHVTSKHIRTNAVSPGPFPPQSVVDTMPDFHEKLCQKTPMKRIGQPNEVAAAVHFLLSNDASYINGVNLPVDGGWTVW